MTPNYERAAIAAMNMLIKHNISTAPVDPLPVFKRTPGVLVLSFTEMSRTIGVDRNNLLSAFDTENHDAVTSVHFEDGQLRYLVTYNQRLPFYLLQRALARELGHIVLGHDGSRPMLLPTTSFVPVRFSMLSCSPAYPSPLKCSAP